ncbi:bifunctional 2-keto-4-hydroxyglutarate aldolase/2-keto-3-deoxy-6-phosphogluconate aldolase [Candidatus Enterococcus ferrettii]|uniref:2-dehydro-3-deoxyphosphogluconate aldolase/(4S)-4-hydroxy-2-oxoglutarate aldolase n=1 Tax=Candidatus Enterococcus ferrettii TaxID=2815324 RepID=A0ABV0ERX6_9ENTE|nr:bifunctional 2-keto-4-hydroxyglutarate aldolase/2-keto-3-deoxy-6-phosphogluconate aldolase [Enterococcus sp. 665A]
MQRINLLQQLRQSGVIAVVRGNNKDEALSVCRALIKGGIIGIEVTLTVPEAESVIQELKKEQVKNKKIVIGAGTVLHVSSAERMIMAGADFIVSPSFDQATAEICNLYQIPYLPGCATITEMQQALKSGVEVIKLFPGSSAGPKMIKAIKGPLPQVNLMPTGGVNLDNLAEWHAAGAVMVGVGGNLLAGDLHQITKAASQYKRHWDDLEKNE